MNSQNYILLLPILFSFLSCNIEKKPILKITEKDFLGEWYFLSSPLAGYEFQPDSSFYFWEDEDHQSGTWLLKDSMLFFNNDNSAWSETFKFKGRDSLILGKALFTKNFFPIKEKTLWEEIIGGWITQKDSLQIEMTFNVDSSYFQTFKGRGVAGMWELKKDTLVLDGFDKYGKLIKIKKDSLFWSESVYWKLK